MIIAFYLKSGFNEVISPPTIPTMVSSVQRGVKSVMPKGLMKPRNHISRLKLSKYFEKNGPKPQCRKSCPPLTCDDGLFPENFANWNFSFLDKRGIQKLKKKSIDPVHCLLTHSLSAKINLSHAGSFLFVCSPHNNWTTILWWCQRLGPCTSVRN